jgi:hypothetical protein
MIIYINGRGMNAPELKAYISELEAENAELRAKVESAERQKAEYKRLLKAAVEGFNFLGAWMDEHGDCTLDCSDCPLHRSGYYCRGWNKEDEALALIGEDGDTNG